MESKICAKCGETGYDENFMKGPISTIMQQRGICFHCAFWLTLAKEHNENPLWLRIEGVSYIAESVLDIKQKSKREWGKGFGGTEFHIRLEDGTEFRTDNLWYQGEMPDWFAKSWPNNAEFIKGK
jgi:hypothetical protein